MTTHIHLTIKEAQHFLAEAEYAEQMRCPDTQTQQEEFWRLKMIKALRHKLAAGKALSSVFGSGGVA